MSPETVNTKPYGYFAILPERVDPDKEIESFRSARKRNWILLGAVAFVSASVWATAALADEKPLPEGKFPGCDEIYREDNGDVVGMRRNTKTGVPSFYHLAEPNNNILRENCEGPEDLGDYNYDYNPLYGEEAFQVPENWELGTGEADLELDWQPMEGDLEESDRVDSLFVSRRTT